MECLTISESRTRTVVAPLRRPIRTASGAIEASPLLFMDVETHQGVVGRAYLFAYTKTMLDPLREIAGTLADLVRGHPVDPVARQAQLEQHFRLLGLQGLLGMAVSTLDMALWDALATAAGVPVVPERIRGRRTPAFSEVDVPSAAQSARQMRATCPTFYLYRILFSCKLV
jgi:mandelate racemase